MLITGHPNQHLDVDAGLDPSATITG
jgi:hypothetical protein